MSDQDHPSGLHIHGFGLVEGHLHVDLATNNGRCLHVELDPADNPNLKTKFDEFCAAIRAATDMALLDIIGMGRGIPETSADLERVTECYVCGVKIHTTEPPGVKVYCTGCEPHG